MTTTVLGTDYGTSATGLYNFLLENAVPKYFTNVTFSEGTITCYVGDTPFLTIVSTTSPLSITVRTKYNYSQTFTIQNRWFRFAYKCTCGITLCADNDLPPMFTITRDENGLTTLITSSNLNTSSNSTNIFVINPNTTTQTLSNAYHKISTAGSGDYVKTTLAPIVVNGADGDIVSDTLFIICAQFTMTGNYDRTWIIDGVHYWSNGLWVVKDEG